MNCQECTNALDDYLDQWLPPGQVEAVESHTRDCPACRTRLARERTLREQLRRLPAPMPDDEWCDRAIATAVEHEQAGRRRRRLGLGGGLAATLALVIGLTVQQSGGDIDAQSPPDISPDISMALNEEREVNLVVESPRNLDHARFTVHLPKGIEMAGFPGHDKVSWDGRLESGKNLLVLPLRAAAGNGGDVVTHVAYTGKRKTFTLRMKVQDDRGSRLPPAANTLAVM